MAADHIVSIDQGTTSTRAVVFGPKALPVASFQREHRQITPAPGLLEHDPLEILEMTCVTVREAMNRAGVKADRIAAVGITNQRETTVVWDRHTGRPFTNAIVWQDTRTGDLCRALAGDAGPDRYRAMTGLPLSTYFSGPKLLWILENSPAAKKAAMAGEALFGTIDSWLIWNLTGGPLGGSHVTDVTNASRTLLMDLAQTSWSEHILGEMGIPRSLLPEIRASSEPEGYGFTKGEGPFGGEIPITSALGDQQAALFGQTCFQAGEAKNTYGTGCFLLMNTGGRPVASKAGLLTTVAYKIGKDPAVYALEGSVAVAGAAVQWLRDQLGIINSAAEIEALASTVADSGDVYFVPAFSGLFAPRWRADARGVITGLTRYAGRAHIARAVLEAVAYQTREVIEAMETDSGTKLETLKADGGMTANRLLMQIQADALGIPVAVPENPESTALGAAFGAGLAAGLWKDTEELKTLGRAGGTVMPGKGSPLRTKGYERWKKAVEKSLDWV